MESQILRSTELDIVDSQDVIEATRSQDVVKLWVPLDATNTVVRYVEHFLNLCNGVVIDNHTAIEEAGGENIGVDGVPGDAPARGVDANSCDVCDRLVIRVVPLDINALI